MTRKEAVYAHKSDECRGTCCTSHSDGSQARTQITSSPHSKIIYSLFWPVSISARLYSSMRLEKKKKSTSIVAVHKWKRFSTTFPLPVKKCCFLASFELKFVIFSPWCSQDALLSSSRTMATVEHPAGAPQLGISRIVLDIFGFHQSKWLQFSIKMLNLVLEPSGQGRKYEAVPLDDKWPSFDWANREIRAAV